MQLKIHDCQAEVTLWQQSECMVLYIYIVYILMKLFKKQANFVLPMVSC